MEARYYKLITQLKDAREAGDKTQEKKVRRQLDNWRIKYGAHAPISKNTTEIW